MEDNTTDVYGETLLIMTKRSEGCQNRYQNYVIIRLNCPFSQP
jgi:hypothetical protein